MSTDDGDAKLPPTGRFTRFRKLATLGARMGTDVVAQGVRRFTSGEQSLLSKGAAETLVSVLGEMKGAAMKVGQMVALDDELLTPEIRKVIARLQNQAPPMPFSTVEQVILEDLGRPASTLFAELERTPLAAASLGQVHRGKTHDGHAIAVKVQYPGIAEALASDLDNVGSVVRAIGMTSKALDGGPYYEELRTQLEREADYRIEAENAELFRVAASTLPELVVPRVYRELSGRRVLTQELLEGTPLKDWLHEDPSPAERYRVARLLLRGINGPFLAHGVLQADPHPGNFLVRADGRLGMLDFGAVKAFSDTFVEVNRETLGAALAGTPFDSVGLSRKIGFDISLPDEQARELIDEILRLAGRPFQSSDYDYAEDRAVYELKLFFGKNAPRLLKIRPPPEAMVFFRANAILSQDLKLVGARGDFRDVFAGLPVGATRG